MSVAASVVLTTARTLLNDDAATLWTDAVLFPKLAQAHRELQTELRFAGSPVMRGEVGGANSTFSPILYTATTKTISSPVDMMEPITLFEKLTTDAYQDYLQMTEADPLPVLNNTASATLKFWQWSVSLPEVINLLGCNINKHIRIIYWRILTIPTLNTDTIGFTNGELWLAPRVAAIAASTVGNKDVSTECTSMAKEFLNKVILSNRGRLQPASGSTARP